MASQRVYSEIQLVNGSVGDPVLYVDYPDRDNALLFDGGDNTALPMAKLADLEAVFISHHHVDHFIGLDRIIRANIDGDKLLSIFGPEGTIQKTYDRIKSYEYQYFPFQKIVVRVCEIFPDRLVCAMLECRRRFPPPQVEVQPRHQPEIFENDEVVVEAAHADHTVPCLAYAMIEKPGYHFHGPAVEQSNLREGPWVAQTLLELEKESPSQTIIEIEGGRFELGGLARKFFRKSPGVRVAFITDTAWSDASRENLISLAQKSERLYCDSFYLEAQSKQAEKYRHMTAARAATLAAEAKVKQLVLIHFSRRYQGRYHLLLEEAQKTFPHVTMEV